MAAQPSLYEECMALFSPDHWQYQLTVETANRRGTVRYITYMVQDSAEFQFFTLSHHYDMKESYFWLSRKGKEVARLEEGGIADRPDLFWRVLDVGMALPRHGSLFGWRASDGTVTALFQISTHYTPRHPEPSWGTYLSTDAAADMLPPFTPGQSLVEVRFWKRFQAGEIVNLKALIGQTVDQIFWTQDGVIAVRVDLSSGSFTLPSGCYLDRLAQRKQSEGVSLGEILTRSDKVDLGSKFDPNRRSSRARRRRHRWLPW